MNKSFTKALSAGVVVSALFAAGQAQAACSDVSRSDLQTAANTVRALHNTGGLDLNMWVTVVDETGKVCHVVNTGEKGASSGNSQWLGSRVISAQKANTANAFSLDTVSISSGSLYAAVQPGGSLFGLQESNPVDASVAYKGLPATYGTAADPLVGKRIGGVNVFGGGIALYNGTKKIGAIGVSGDTSCTDHAFAWSVRHLLGKDVYPSGIAKVELLTLKTTVSNGTVSESGIGALGDHPDCGGSSNIQTNDFGFVPNS